MLMQKGGEIKSGETILCKSAPGRPRVRRADEGKACTPNPHQVGQLAEARKQRPRPAPGTRTAGSGPRSTQTQVSSADPNLQPRPLLLEGHGATGWGGTACAPRATLWVEGHRAMLSGGKKKENGRTEHPEQSWERLHCPGGKRGQASRAGQMWGSRASHWGGPMALPPAHRDSGLPAARPPAPSLHPTPPADLCGLASFPSAGQ